MDIPIETSLRGHESGSEILAMTRLSFFATGLVWHLSHPSPLSVYKMQQCSASGSRHAAKRRKNA